MAKQGHPVFIKNWKKKLLGVSWIFPHPHFLNVVFYSRASNIWWATAVDWEPAGDWTHCRGLRGVLFLGENLHFLSSSCLKRPHVCSELLCLLSKGCPFLFYFFSPPLQDRFAQNSHIDVFQLKKPVPLTNDSHPIRHGNHPTSLTSCSIF